MTHRAKTHVVAPVHSAWTLCNLSVLGVPAGSVVSLSTYRAWLQCEPAGVDLVGVDFCRTCVRQAVKAIDAR